MSIIRLIVFCIFAVILAFFAVSNRSMVDLTYWPGHALQVSLFIIVLVTLIIGVFIGWLATAIPLSSKVMHEKRAKRKIEKQLQSTEQQLQQEKQRQFSNESSPSSTVKDNTLGDIPVKQQPSTI